MAHFLEGSSSLEEHDMAIPYYHVDAFTGELFAGNPAGDCILFAFLADSIMQKIAAENRHSETAFVVPRADHDFDLRWFPGRRLTRRGSSEMAASSFPVPTHP